MQTEKIAISVIIVGFHSKDVLPECFQSITKQNASNIETIYVENCPEDSSIDWIQQNYPRVKCVAAEKNAGFGAGCNLGAKNAVGEYLFFLNPDTEIRTADTLKNMVNFMENAKEIGIAAPLFSDLTDTSLYGVPNKDIAIQYSGEKELGPKFSNLPGKCAWICGAGLMISRKLFTALHGFDEQFFMYSEDVDLCLRVRKEGYAIAQVMQTNVMHRGSESTKAWGKRNMIYRTTQSDYYFTKKHYSSAQHALIWKKRKRRYRLHMLKNIFFSWRKVHRYGLQLGAIKNAKNTLDRSFAFCERPTLRDGGV